jgi:hypothetical protein
VRYPLEELDRWNHRNLMVKRQVTQHLSIGIRTMEKLADMPMERLHSRKLRNFSETAFQWARRPGEV